MDKELEAGEIPQAPLPSKENQVPRSRSRSRSKSKEKKKLSKIEVEVAGLSEGIAGSMIKEAFFELGQIEGLDSNSEVEGKVRFLLYTKKEIEKIQRHVAIVKEQEGWNVSFKILDDFQPHAPPRDPQYQNQQIQMHKQQQQQQRFPPQYYQPAPPPQNMQPPLPPSPSNMMGQYGISHQGHQSHPGHQGNQMMHQGYPNVGQMRIVQGGNYPPAPPPPKPPSSPIKLSCDARALKDPKKMAKFLMLPPDILQNVIYQLANNSHIALVANNIQVREIWIGNLPSDINEKVLKKVFSTYGEIENIELFQNPNKTFAFLKYMRFKEAITAFDNVENLSKKVGACLKISYSDYQKRPSIVGDSVEVKDNKEDLSRFVFMSFKSGIPLPREHMLRSKLSEFGEIKSVLLRPSYNNNLKSFILVEMNTVDEAMEVRKYFYEEDTDGRRRSRLGYRKLEINILLNQESLRPFEAAPAPPLSMLNQRANYNGGLLDHIQGGQREQTPKDILQELFGEDNEKSKREKKKLLEMQAEAQNSKQKEDVAQPLSNVERQKVYFWSGFLTKRKTERLGVDAYIIGGDEEFVENLLDAYLNISHRTSFDEVLSKTPISVIVFTPTNELMRKGYNDYVRYFKEKRIAGIVNHLKNKVHTLLYLVPCCEEFRHVAPLAEEGQLIGVITPFQKPSETEVPSPEKKEEPLEEPDPEMLKKPIPKFDPDEMMESESNSDSNSNSPTNSSGDEDDTSSKNSANPDNENDNEIEKE